jgi:arylsulfatase A-like enzyme
MGERDFHVVLISIDTLNRSSLAAFDSTASKLPNLDHFAQTSSRFLNAYSTASWTLPAHASLFTGLYPDRHGATHQKLRISEGIHTLADSLAAAGFETVAFTNGGFVDPSFGFGKGFEYYDGWSAKGSRLSRLELPRGGKPQKDPGRSLFDRAIAFISQHQPSDPPFFLFLQTYAVHNYYRLHRWAIQASGGVFDRSQLRKPSEYLKCMRGRIPCSEEWLALSQLYRGELVNLDAGFGRLMEALDDAQLGDSTLVVFLSDHGEGFDFTNHRLHHGGRLHEDVIRIPLMLRGPSVVAQPISDAISLVDVMPTVLDLAGLPIPPELDGVSMAASVRGEKASGDPQRYAMEFSQWWNEDGLQNTEEIRASPLQLAVIEPDLWYIRDSDSREEIYDMREDPKQLKSLGGPSESVERLRVLANLRWDRRPPQEKLIADDEIQRQLRALGYLD